MLSREKVKHIAKLARISLTEEEVGKFQKELSSILEYVDKLKEVNTKRVEPALHSLREELTRESLKQIREDRVEKEEEETVKNLIKAAPEKKGRFIKVKSVFEDK